MEIAQVSGDEDESDEEEGMKFDGENEAGKDSNKSESDEE